MGEGGQSGQPGGPGGDDGSGQGGDSRQAGGQESGDGELGGDGEGAGGEQGDWPAGGSGAAGRVSEAEGTFNESLDDFDEIMGAEQEAIARSGVGTAADEGFGGAGAPDASGASGTGGSADGGGTVPAAGSGGRSGESEAARRPVLARARLPEEAPPPVEGCEDDDKVARQLCEAATKEEDPLLRAALWDEYNEYKKILARQ